MNPHSRHLSDSAPKHPASPPRIAANGIVWPRPGRLFRTLALHAAQWRARQLIRSALYLAEEPGLVLDLPCAADEFWPLLHARDNRVVIAAEANVERLAAALANLHKDFSSRVHALQTSLFAIDLSSNAVDCIFCMHCLHQIDDPQQRMALLREFHRVTRDSVIISLWVDGNLEAVRQARHAHHNGYVHKRAEIEEAFIRAGFSITGHRDFIPGLAMLRLYVLRKVT